MLEILRTDFQLRLLWGSRGAAVDQTERYDKFKLILTALSRKLEPPVKHTELWKTRHLYIHIRLSEPLCGVRSKVICIWKRTFSTRMWASIDHMQIASWKPFMCRNGTLSMESYFVPYASSRGVLCSTLMKWAGTSFAFKKRRKGT